MWQSSGMNEPSHHPKIENMIIFEMFREVKTVF